jgi:hypothetical protein
MMSDSFDPAAPRIPTAVERLEVRLFALDDGAGGTGYDASYRFPIIDANGDLLEDRQGDLIPHLTAAQKTKLTSLMDALFAKAKGSIGP